MCNFSSARTVLPKKWVPVSEKGKTVYYSEDNTLPRTILKQMKTIKVKIKPGAKEAKVTGRKDMYGNQSFEIYVKALPKNNEANTEMLELLGDYFNVPKSYIKIKSGFKSRNKIVLIPEK